MLLSKKCSGDISGQPKGTKEIDGYVGFANLPNQVYRKSVKKGFEFTLMVVGKCIYFCAITVEISCQICVIHMPKMVVIENEIDYV